jgi:transcription initiation factor IIF auxiliary subunit
LQKHTKTHRNNHLSKIINKQVYKQTENKQTEAKIQTEKQKERNKQRGANKHTSRKKHTFVVHVLLVRDDGDVFVGRGPLDLHVEGLRDRTVGYQDGNLLVEFQGCDVP